MTDTKEIKKLTFLDTMQQVGKYRGWKKGHTHGFSLGNNKKVAIELAKANGLDEVLKIAKVGMGEYIYLSDK
jgi:hypothetical protein